MFYPGRHIELNVLSRTKRKEQMPGEICREKQLQKKGACKKESLCLSSVFPACCCSS